MATTIGTEYDHIDITNGVSTIRHPLKDTSARENLVKVQDTQPQSNDNVLWVKETPEAETQVPTYVEFQEVSGDVSSLKSAIDDAPSEETGLALLALEQRKTEVLGIVLDEMDTLIQNLPSDEMGLEIRDKLVDTNGWLDMIYNEMVLREAV